MNIIFLDVDGVLNSINNLINLYNENNRSFSGDEYPFDPNCLENLKELVNDTNSHLVISSTWKYSKESINVLLAELRKYNLDKLVIGYTPILGLSRGKEIKRYLSTSKFADDVNFVILDDDTDMEDLIPFLVQTNRQFGLTKENVTQAKEKLLKKR